VANAGGGRGTAVCDVEAPPESVWKAILGFDRYAGRLAQCSKSRVYEQSKSRMARSETYKVHMKLAGGVKTFNCYYDHTYEPHKNQVTWTLDPDHTSDFLDVQGQWCVFKHPTKKDWSRVWYSADVVLPPWLPRAVVVVLCKTSGTKALTFCKKEAELNAKKAKGGVKNPFAKFRGGFKRPAPLAPLGLKR
jgi:ribosome-associated toxin RatA of RatAB toxin-antitoxin module